MNDKTQALQRPVRLLLVLLFSWSAMLCWSQEEPTELPAPVATEVDPNDAAKPGPDPDTVVSPTNQNSPLDYRPSEEISQDLSVSFPVDI